LLTLAVFLCSISPLLICSRSCPMNHWSFDRTVSFIHLLRLRFLFVLFCFCSFYFCYFFCTFCFLCFFQNSVKFYLFFMHKLKLVLFHSLEILFLSSSVLLKVVFILL
jgi:hypothetical protein